MNLQHFGTEYGGWWIDTDRVTGEGVVIDAGVGTDISFAQGLASRWPKLKFVGVDHTDDSAEFVKRVAMPNYTLIQALISARGFGERRRVFRNPKLGSESMFEDHRFVDPSSSYDAPIVILADLVREYKPVIVKLDIEGAEYEVFSHAFGVPQVCIEFHHRMMSRYTREDTEAVLDEFRSAGYDVAHQTPTDEVLLVLR